MKKKSLFILCLIMVLSGCTTVKSMTRPHAGGGRAQIYEADLKETFDLALYACRVMAFDIEDQNLEKKYIVASNGMSFTSYGEIIGIYFKELGPKETEVMVVSKPQIKTHVFAPKWVGDIHMYMNKRYNDLYRKG